MSNLKRRYIEVTIAVVILLILTLSGGYVFGDDKPVKPLVDFMFTPSNSIYADYGFSDETFQFFNFVRLKEICQIHEAQIAALRAEIDELKKLVAELKHANMMRTDAGGALAGVVKIESILDPNEVANLKEGVWTDYTVYPREVAK